MIDTIESLCREIDNASFDDHEKLEKRVTALASKAGKGVKVGKLLRFGVADGYALYFITKVTTNKVYIRHVALYDAYGFQGVARDRVGCYIPRSVAKSAVGWDDLMDESRDESETFFENLKPGSVVHYCNGFNNYVRCEVTQDHQLMPRELVGDWKSYDLPQRQRDGSIYLGYHAQSIVKKEAFRPHASNVYEFNHKASAVDPRGLPAQSLEVRPMTANEEIEAGKYKLLNHIQEIVRSDEHPDRIFVTLKTLLA